MSLSSLYFKSLLRVLRVSVVNLSYSLLSVLTSVASVSSIFEEEVRQADPRPGSRNRHRAGVAAPVNPRARTVAWSEETEFC